MAAKEKDGKSITQVALIDGHDNGVDPEQEESIEETFPIEALEKLDDSLPKEYEDEILASELLDNLSVYHRSEKARKAARHQGDHKKAEELGKQAAICRTAAALIQYEHPGTIPIYKELARAKAIQSRKSREGLLEDEE